MSALVHAGAVVADMTIDFDPYLFPREVGAGFVRVPGGGQINPLDVEGR